MHTITIKITKHDIFVAEVEYLARDVVKAAGFKWNRETKRWESPHAIVVKRLKTIQPDLTISDAAKAFYTAEVKRIASLPKCDRCAGTGEFITAVVNGKPTGPGGICYRCDGKGYQSGRDEERNDNYDRYCYLSQIA